MDSEKIWSHQNLKGLHRAWYNAFALNRATLKNAAPEKICDEPPLVDSATSSADWPTLGQLAQCGANIDHPGFGLIGSHSKPGRNSNHRKFKFIDTGPDHTLQTGLNIVGRNFDELAHPAHVKRLEKVFFGVFESSSPHAWRCMNMARNATSRVYSRVLVPVRDDVGDGRCLFGIWIWDKSPKDLRFGSAPQEAMKTRPWA